MKRYFAFCLLLLASLVAAGQSTSPNYYRQIMDSLRREKAAHKQAYFLYEAAKYQLEKPNEDRRDLDSALAFNKRSTALYRKENLANPLALNILLDARIHDEMGNTTQAKALKQAALKYALDNNAHQSASSIYLSMADDVRDSQEEQKTALFKQALTQAERAKNYHSKIDVYRQHAGFLANLGKYDLAVEETQKALALKRRYQDPDVRDEKIIIAANLRMMYRLKEAAKYALEALRTTESDNTNSNDSDLLQVHNLLGLIYYDLKLNNESLENYRKAFAIAQKINDRYAVHTIAQNLATILNRQKRNAEAIAVLDSVTKDYQTELYAIRYAYLYTVLYAQSGQLQKAYPHYKEVLKYYHEGNATGQDKHIINIAIAYYLYHSNQPSKMYPYLDEIYEVAKREHSLLRLSEIQKLYFKADSVQGQYLSAIKHLNEYKILNDSINSTERAKELTALQLQYNTEKKDRDIVMLQQKGLLQQSKLKNEASIRYIFIVGIVVLTIFVGFLYGQNSIKKRSNQKLQQQQQEINAQNDKLKSLIMEKEWLLKEIHHRVKNNMQIIISLLNTQSAYLDNDDAKKAIQNSQNRMHAMSLIHQKLYQTNNLSRIDMSWYIHELTEYLKDSFDQEKHIRFNIQVEKIDVDVSQAVPIGLILNEAINNAMKHAFKDREGVIFITLKNIRSSPCNCLLSIADNGVGMHLPNEHVENDSFGMNLMRGLTAQLDGKFELLSDQGVFITIQFPQKDVEL